MVYLKLIFRGILRHKKRGLKFFALLAICFMMVIFSLSFQDSFYQAYLQLGINARNAHISIFSPDSVWLKDSFTSIQKEDLPTIKIDQDFDNFVNDLPEVEVGTRLIETGGVFFTYEGKAQSGGTITGVKAADFKKILPGIVLIKGKDDFTAKPGAKDIPFLRWVVQESEKIKNLDKFVVEDFKVTGAKFDAFKAQVIKDFPEVFHRNQYQGAAGTVSFINDLNAALGEKDLSSHIPKSYTENYNFDTIYLIDQIKKLPFEDQSELRNWNKRLLQTLYPDAINEVPEGIALNKPMGLFVPLAKSANKSLIPIKFTGVCDGIPQFYGFHFIDLGALQNSLGLAPDECTSYLIRLKDEKKLPLVLPKIKDYIKSRGLNYKAVDYMYLGNKIYMPIATAMSAIFQCLIVLFLLISVFFVSYMVMTSLIRRRKEMGTVITLGMSRAENIWVFLGETVVIITVAWLIGSVLMAPILLFLVKIGMGGIVFFPKGILHFLFKYDYFYQAYFLILIPAILVAVVPALNLRRVNIVDLLKGELSKRKKTAESPAKSNILKTGNGQFFLMFKLSLRNILANRRRSLIIFIIFTSVITILYLFLAYADGAVSNFRNGYQALNNPRSDIIATKKGYANLYKTNSNSDQLKDLTISNYEEIRRQLLKLDYVHDVYAKTTPVTMDLYIGNSRFKNLVFRGVDPSMADYISSKINIIEGRMIRPEEENALILNIISKPDLKTKVGDTVTVLGNDLYNNAVAEDFKVVGFFRPKIDNPFFTTLVFTDVKSFNSIAGYFNHEINFLNLNLKPGVSIQTGVQKLNQWAAERHLDLEFNDFSKVYVQNDQTYGAAKMLVTMITYLVIIFVLIGIINMIRVNLFDRRREIGAYYCLGAEKSLLMGIYSLELLIINICATVVGTIFGLGIQFYINALKITSANPGMQIVFGGNTFHLDFNFTTIGMLFIGVTLITTLISLISLRSSLKVSPVVALREVEE